MNPDHIATMLAAAVHEHRLPGFVWALVDEHGTEHVGEIGYRADTIFRIASLTKPIVGCVAASLVDKSVISLDTPVTRWLPELANRRVLRTPGSALSDTVAARRSLTVHDLLTLGLGLGFDATARGDEPLITALTESGAGPGAFPPAMNREDWLSIVVGLPMAHQPGEGWLYDSAFTALGILLERAAGLELGELIDRDVAGPAHMIETGYAVPDTSLVRVPELLGYEDGALVVLRAAGDPLAASNPKLPGGATGLFSTRSDLLAFATALRDGVIGGSNFAHDLRAPGQHSSSTAFLGPDTGWGWGVAVAIDGPHLGGYGWSGGTGTTAWIDPSRGTIAILLGQADFSVPGVESTIDAFLSLTKE